MCVSDKLIFLLKTNANGKGSRKYCLYYEDSKIKKSSWNS